jgi:protease-4
MPVLSPAIRALARWRIIVPVMIGLGVAAGALVFIYVSPGRPNIGVINVPFTVLNENTAHVLGEYLDYARRDDSIKAVVLNLTSPGGGAAASERLYIETRRLRQEKPVIVVMKDLVASGGYMMAMGASHTFVQTSSLVGNVGVVSFAGPLIAPIPDETVVYSGPYKLEGKPRRDWVATNDQLAEAFAEIVIGERGDRLQISKQELKEARIYAGLEAVRLGLADEVGGESDAYRKAAELAGISNYGFVDINIEVLRELLRDLEDVLSLSAGPSASGIDDLMELVTPGSGSAGESPDGAGPGEVDPYGLSGVRDLMLYGRISAIGEDPLPDFPLQIGRPNVYYLYVGNEP